MPESLTPTESAVLTQLLAGDAKELALLRSQLERVAPIGREFTGCGFYVNFDPESIPTDLRLPPAMRFQLGDVTGVIDQVACGFILFVESGGLSMLECHTWGGEALSKAEPLDRLRYLRRGEQGLEEADFRDAARGQEML